MMMILDVIAILLLVVAAHDWLNPDSPWVVAHLQFNGYIWVLLGAGSVLFLISLISVVRSFSGKGLSFADDI